MDAKLMKWIKRILKWIGVTVAALFGLVVIVYVGLLYINRSDEPPSAAAVAFAEMVQKSPSPDTDDNAMLYYIGINVPQGKDPLVQGKAWLKWSRLSARKQWKTDEPRGESLSYQLDNDETQQLSNLIQSCSVPTSDCLSQLNTQSEMVWKQLNKVRWILDRYERLLRYTKWHSTNINSPLTILTYNDTVTLNRLYNLHVWQLTQNGNTEQALKALDREARFWRMVLANSRTLIGKLVVNRLLNNNLRWTNVILHHAPSGLKSAVPESWKKSITLPERSLKSALANELLLAKSVMEQRDEFTDEISALDRVGNALAAPLIKLQAMQNLIASDYDRVNNALDLPYSELPDSLNALRQHQEKESHQDFYHAYNPLGYILYRIGNSADIVDYGLRIADLEGKRRVLQLASTLRDKGVAPEEVPSHLVNSDIRNPYTGEAFGWDEKTKSITFEGADCQNKKAFRLPY